MNIGRTAVGKYISRARRAGLGWPLAEDLSDEDLERLLFPPSSAVSPDRRPLPDWPALHRDFKRPGVTIEVIDGLTGEIRTARIFVSHPGRLQLHLR